MNRIKTYCWQGINSQGIYIKGTLISENISLLKAELRSQGILPIKIRQKKFSSLRINVQHISDFTRQLSQLLTAGIPLLQALEISKQFCYASVLWLIDKLKQEINSGHSLSEAVNKYPQYFDAAYRELIFAGEQSGNLASLLTHVVRYQEKSLQLKNKLKKALIYPTTILVVALSVIFCMITFIVPQFEKLFQNFGTALPFYTRIVISLGQQAKFYIMLILIVAVSSWILYKKARNSERYSYKIDQIALRLPLVKKFLCNAILMRFSRTLATTYYAGLSLDEALTITAKSCGNLLYTQATLDIKAQIIKGESISAAMQQTALFPQRVIQMIAIAEESGTLTQTLNHIAEFYENELDAIAEKVSKLLEPIVMMILGIIIGGIIAALYLPIFKLGNLM
jgi:type IV pilus assembly protein PilC